MAPTSSAASTLTGELSTKACGGAELTRRFAATRFGATLARLAVVLSVGLAPLVAWRHSLTFASTAVNYRLAPCVRYSTAFAERSLTSLFAVNTLSPAPVSVSVPTMYMRLTCVPPPVADALASYLYLIRPPPGAKHKPVDPAKLTLAGDSAGGGLCLALLCLIRDAGLPAPAGGASTPPLAPTPS